MTAPTDESNVLPFPDDDIISLVTGVTLIDAEAHVLARRLRPEPWEARARFFNNIIGGSLENMVKLSEAQFEEGDGARQREFWDMCMLTMHVRIAETLEYWEAETPWDRHAARLHALSARQEHRLSARAFVGEGFTGDYKLFDERSPSMVFFNMSRGARPGLGMAWRQHRAGNESLSAS